MASERDGKIHSHFNQLGTKTGRFSCTEPNLQQIPARNLEVRMMFSADDEIRDEVCIDNLYKVKFYDELEIAENTWKRADNLIAGDKLFTSENNYDIISKIDKVDDDIIIYVQ